MTLLTIFSTPKPFTDPHIAIIQRNAIRSWINLGEEVEVILVGDEPGLKQAATDIGVRLLTNVSSNSHGTPLVSSIFSLARENSTSPLFAYINADILTLPNFLTSSRRMLDQAREFIMVGQRWDLEVLDEMDFREGWQNKLQSDLLHRGKLHPPAGSDYFIFPRACYKHIPDFAIGRAGWDNWMIFHARNQGWLAVDSTKSITIAHQQHDYSHLPGGKPHYKLPETDENIRLAGGREVTQFSLLDLNRRLIAGKLHPRRWNKDSIRRMIESYPLLAWNNAKLTRKITSIFTRFRNLVARGRSSE